MIPAIQNIFYPESVAIIGVSAEPDNLARNILQNMLDQGYGGRIHLVGRRGGEVLGLPIYTDVSSIPGGVELGAILTPAATVPGFMRDCLSKGAKGFWIGTAGFTEFSREGAGLQSEIVRIAGEAGARFVGPNCWGIINTENGLCLPFSRLRPIPRGGVSILAQSGGIGITLLQAMAARNVGLNKFVSLGNKANIDEVDLLKYLAGDPGTKVICVYLESLDRGRDFTEAARSAGKPVILFKSNTSSLSSEIARTHTASLTTDDAVLDSAVRCAGVLRVDTVRDMIDAAAVFSLPLMKGRGLVVLSRSGGHAVVSADLCARLGFRLPAIPQDIIERVHSKLRAGVINLTNPMDLGDMFDYTFYDELLDRILSLDQVDGVMLQFSFGTQRGLQPPLKVMEDAGDNSLKHDKPVAMSLMAWNEDAIEIRKIDSYPFYSTPEESITALHRSLEYFESAQRLARVPAAATGAGEAEGAAVIVKAAREMGRSLVQYDALRAVRALGIETARTAFAHSVEDVRSLAAGMTPPVVLKIECRQLMHKSDAGGVKMGLKTPQEALQAAIAMEDGVRQAVPGAVIDGFVLQETAPSGVELFVGAGRDASFGPFVTVGLGGIFVEVLRDVATRLAPFDRETAAEMLRSLKGYSLLDGARGRPKCDIDAVCDALTRISALAAFEPSVRSMDINPLIVYPKGLGLLVLDARMVIGN